MKGLRRKIIVLAAVAVMVMTSFVGCASAQDSDIVATVGDSKITLGMANFYARQQQQAYEEDYATYQNYMQQQMYGNIVQVTEIDWSADQGEGVTLEESYKDSIMESLQNLYLAEDHMSDYDVEITEDELEEIEKVADEFLKANSDDVKEKISADKDTVVEYLRLMTISAKVEEAIKAGVDSDIPDEEVAKKRFRYVSFEKTMTNEDDETVDLSEKEIKALKKEAEEFLEAAKSNGSLSDYALEKEVVSTAIPYGANYKEEDSLEAPTEVYEAADALEENGFAKLVETDGAFYVIQLETLLDEEATESARETVIMERQEEAVDKTVESWRKDAKIKVYDKVWDTIRMRDIEVTKKEVEDDTEDDIVTEEDVSTEDTTTEDATTEDATTEE